MSYRKDLKPWARKLPKSVLTILIFPLLPIYILMGLLLGIWEGLIDGLLTWKEELSSIRHLKD